MRERIEQLLIALNISGRSFSERIGKSSSFVRTIGTTVGADVINSIIKEFPQVNINWLVTGEGDMMLKTDIKPIDAARAYYIQSYMVNEYISKLGTSENQIKVASLLIPHLVQRDSYFFAFDVLDDRLSKGIEPALRVNDIVIAELISSRDSSFFMALMASPVVVVVLSDKYGQLIRKVTDFKNNEVKLCPTHPFYKNEHVNIDIKDIKMLGIVKTILINNPIFEVE